MKVYLIDNNNSNLTENSTKTAGSFFIIPKAIISNPRYALLSSNAILLYGLMLDRKKLSAVNSLTDDGAPYVYFTLAEICRKLKCSKSTASLTIKELQRAMLIFGKSEKRGKATKYFINEVEPYRISDNGYDKFNTRSSSKNSTEVYRNSYSNNNINNKTLFIEDLLPVEEAIKTNIDYDDLIQSECKANVDSIVEIICDVISSNAKTVQIGRESYDKDYVKKRLYSLNLEHISYVLQTLESNKSNIRDVKGYVLKLLFNAPSTLELYYTAKVSADMAK